MPTTVTTQPAITKAARSELADLSDRYGEQPSHLMSLYREIRQSAGHERAIQQIEDMLEAAAGASMATPASRCAPISAADDG